MDDATDLSKIDTTNLGWRVQQLRLRCGFQQKEFARIAGVDAGFLNRLEHGAPNRSRPKAKTISKLLDALGATPAEREAVFHTEVPRLTPEEISKEVADFTQHAEDDDDPMMLIDEHWYRWYMNRIARRVLEFDDYDYAGIIGENILQSYLDPASPFYSHFPDHERAHYFTQRMLAFRAFYAGQQFDRWYLEVVARVKQIPLAAQIWDQLDAVDYPVFLHRQPVRFTNGDRRTFFLDGQLNILMRNPRFAVLTFKPQDEEARQLLDSLRADK